jgi:hypothetical protein
LMTQLSRADADSALAEALDRWELSLFQHEPFRSEQLRAALRALLGSTAPLRAAVLLEPPGRSRVDLYLELRKLADGGETSRDAADAVRRSLVAILQEGERDGLADRLDAELLGLQATETLRVAG